MDNVTSEILKISEQIKRERARRPLGSEQCCLNCRYWEINDSQSAHPEDYEGDCHRRAPVSSSFGLAQIGMVLKAIQWAAEKSAHIESKENFLEDFETEMPYWTCWPRTHGHEWCGEFEAQTRAALEGAA